MVLDGIVLRGQTKGVKTHGEQHILTIHAPLAGHHIHGGVGAGMAHVQAVAGGIGELHQSIELGLVLTGPAGEGLFVLPLGLPLFFNGGKIVLHFEHFLYLKLNFGHFSAKVAIWVHNIIL